MTNPKFHNRYKLTGSELGELVKIHALFESLDMSVVTVEKPDADSCCNWNVVAFAKTGEHRPVTMHAVETYGREARIKSRTWEAA